MATLNPHTDSTVRVFLNGTVALHATGYGDSPAGWPTIDAATAELEAHLRYLRTHRPPAGRTVRIIGAPWPRFVGLLAVELEPPRNPTQYPWAGLADHHTIVNIPTTHNHSVLPTRHTDELGRAWTCVIAKTDIEPADTDPAS